MQPFVELPDVPTRNVFGKCEKIVELTFDILIESSIVSQTLESRGKPYLSLLKSIVIGLLGLLHINQLLC